MWLQLRRVMSLFGFNISSLYAPENPERRAGKTRNITKKSLIKVFAYIIKGTVYIIKAFACIIEAFD